MTRIVLPDAQALADLVTFAARAQAAVPAGAMRLQVGGGALACTAGILDGTGLLGQGAVVGLRILALAAPSEPAAPAEPVDVTVSTAQVAALSTASGPGPVPVEIAPDVVPPRWAAQAPPRSGWEPVARVEGALLREAARSTDVYADIDALPAGVTHGMAYALRALGLLVGDPVLYRCGRWWRLTSDTGHVLGR